MNMKHNSGFYSPFAIAFAAMVVAFVWSMTMHPVTESTATLPLPAVAQAAGTSAVSN
jgi:hypothetical protein